MKKALFFVGCLVGFSAFAQDNAGYQLPPKNLADLVTAPPTPSVSVDSKGQWMLVSERNTSTTTIAELSQPELRLS